MKTISLNVAQVYTENQTSKYWRDVECAPQTAELKTWSTGHPLFVLTGKIVNSHDKNEVGKTKDVYIQTYGFFLEPKVQIGTYTINQ